MSTITIDLIIKLVESLHERTEIRDSEGQVVASSHRSGSPIKIA